MHLHRSPRNTIAGLAVAVVLGLTSCAGSSDAGAPAATPTPTPESTTTTTTTTVRPTDAIDTTIEIDGAAMHLACRGEGDRTVLLIAGFGSGGDAWNPIATDLAAETRVCTYDRFGTGSSDPAPGPQTFTTQASSLHELLEAAGEPGPFVVVGHSFGGLVAMTFASQHTSEVAGLLLLDASPADWNATACAVPDLGTSATDVWVTTCAVQSEPSQNPESLDGPAAFAELADVGDLGSMPLIVDQADDEGYRTMGLPAEIGDNLTDTWDRGQERWAELSTNSQLNRIPDTTHDLYVEQPEVVLTHIRSLLTAS